MENQALLEHRILFLGEEVSPESANRLMANLLLLDAEDHEAQIDLYVNSPGGSVTDGLAIIDAMRCISAPVSTICVGMASSIAALILAAGAPGRRLITPNSEVMIHQASAGFSGQASDIRVLTERLLGHQELIETLLAEWSGQPVERIRQDMQTDHFMNAHQALEYGLVDEIVQPAPDVDHAGGGSRNG